MNTKDNVCGSTLLELEMFNNREMIVNLRLT